LIGKKEPVVLAIGCKEDSLTRIDDVVSFLSFFISMVLRRYVITKLFRVITNAYAKLESF